MMAGVICVGIATLDTIFAVPEMPARAEKYRAGGLAVVGGGNAGTAAVAIARLGGRSHLATRLGDDLTAQVIEAEFATEGVDCSLARRFPGHRSSTSAILVDRQGERLIVNYSDDRIPADASWLPEELPAGIGAALGDTRWPEGALRLFSSARARGVPTVLDADRHPPVMELLSAASHVAFSAQALRELAGSDDLPRSLAGLAHHFQAWLAVTDGDRGVHFVENGTVAHLPAFAVTAVDTLGAGDVWHGAFALRLAEGGSERDAIRFASATAALKCTRFGGRAGAPRRAEVEALLARCAG
jgi:sulfofructose kinase